MSQIAININNLSKKHKIHNDNQQNFKEKFISFFFNKKTCDISKVNQADSFWALKNVFLTINKGESIGIIGKNGAGKSTLLKILSEITTPSEGSIEIFGKTASILEIGMGFHPDLSGRDNIYFSGSLYGMTQSEIDNKYQSIVAFSGISEFLNTPVKHYSTGMYVRLAFSIIIHVEADTLILDEVLTVGDAEFKYKTFKKIKSLQEQGKTIVMVSHNLSEVLEICDKALILEKGQIKSIGNPFQIAAEYLSNYGQDNNQPDINLTNALHEQNQVSWNDPTVAPGNEMIKLRKISILPLHKNALDFNIFMKDEALLEVETINSGNDDFNVAFQLKDMLGNPLFSSTTAFRDGIKTTSKGIYKYSCIIPSKLLNAGTFSITLAILDKSHKIFLTLKDILFFKVQINPEEKGQAWEGRFNEPLRPLLDWKIEKIK